MAVFTATNPGALDPSSVNLAGDIQAAQQIQSGRNALSMQNQQVADQQQEVDLRPGLAARDPNALSQLSAINPALAGQYQNNWAAQAQLPLQYLQRQSQAMAAAAQGVVAAQPQDRPAAYAQMLATVKPYGLGQGLPDQYPGDGALSQIAMFGADPDKILTYLQNRPYTAGGTGPSVPGGSTSVPSGQPVPPGVNPATVGLQGPQGPNSPRGLGDGSAPDASQLAVFNKPLTAADGVGAPQASPADLASMNLPAPPSAGASATPPGGYTPGAPGDVSAQQPDPSIDVSASGTPPPAAPAVAAQVSAPPQAQAAPPSAAPARLPPDALLKNGVPIEPTPGWGITSGGQTFPLPSVTPGPPAYIQKAQEEFAAAHGRTTIRDAQGNLTGYSLPTNSTDNLAYKQAAATADARGTAAPNAAVTLPDGTVPPVVPPASPPPIAQGALPLPAQDPWAGRPNNAATASAMQSARDEVTKQTNADAKQITGAQQTIAEAMEFKAINARQPTNIVQNSPFAGVWRQTLGRTGSQADFDTLHKLQSGMVLSDIGGLGLARIDIPIVKSLMQNQPSTVNVVQANDNIANMKIGVNQRNIAFLQAKATFGQQNGTLDGFPQMWSDYTNANPALSQLPNGYVVPNSNAPAFQAWTALRSDPNSGRYNPALANYPDATLLQARNGGGASGQSAPATALPQTRQAAAVPSNPMADPRYAATHQDQQYAQINGQSQPTQAPAPAASVAVGTIATGPSGHSLMWNGSQWQEARQ